MNALNETDWYSLEQSVKDGKVIPIIGPDALMVVYEGRTIPFYRLVSADLLKSFQMEPEAAILQHTWSLPRAVSAILAEKGSPRIEQRIRREVSRLVAHYSDIVEPAGSLRLLAGIRAFTLFVSLTPDNLLERVMRTVNPSLVIKTSSYSPRDASESLGDLLLRQGERGIFQMLGSCTQVGSGFAIHEEDTLEHLYRLQSDGTRRLTTILSELRRRDKLLINCNFPDWLGRAMLRLINDNRLYTTDKTTWEFLCPHADDAGLHAFLTQYSLNTIGFDGETDALIKKLAQILETVQPPPASPAMAVSKANGQGPTIFVSYASENAGFVRMIADRLPGLGFSDVWLDRKKLIGGDDWSDRIDEAIEKCDFFMPVISREADAQREKVFWSEWKDAIKRSRRVKDVFLIPVGIDPDFPAKASYQRIADGETAVFFDKHLIHAPQGILSPTDCDALAERCRRFQEAPHD
ncbi:toll/interleukin-1 receptor domain-containing protein [Nitrosomonas sp.]|uniref:toll/interleukin-1 receptor domain-containing protein n=1 Tax=Nitrosomonas sp. TaxID=42353 RepID=UPI00208A29C5|nr:toll/interleukin-1 receptor domain-containing protein [Nitrosomonas sp.]GJL76022.1 MAG: hypothetical protein NMNS02_21280 [Nitrosomonas sp.]